MDWWTIGSIGCGLLSLGFGAAKGVHERNVAKQEQKEEIIKAVEQHFEKNLKIAEDLKK